MRSALHNGSAILFGIAILVFLTTFAYQLWVFADLVNGMRAGSYEGSKPDWVSLITAFATALNSAALPFIGACVVDRFDRLLGERGK